MIKKLLRTTLVLLVLLPLTYLLFLHIQADILYASSERLYRLLFSDKLLNSFILAVVVGGIGTFLALCIALLYYHIQQKYIRFIFALSLSFFFFVPPLIYASLFSQIESFQHLSAFVRSVAVLLVWLTPLGSAVVIVSMGSIDKHSFEMLIFTSIQKKDQLYSLLLKQMLATLSGVFMLLFLMTFTQEEVASFFGYRTYAEEFLSRIVLQEQFESTLFYALPFILISLMAFVIFYMLLKHKKVILRQYLYSLKYLEFVRDKKIFYITFAMAVVFGMAFLNLFFANMDFTLFIRAFEENIAVVVRSVALAALGAVFVTFLSVYFVIEYTKQTTLLIFICVTSLYWLLPSSLNALVLLEFSQYFYIESDIYSYILLLYAYILRVLPIGLLISAILYKREEQNFLSFVTISKYKKFMKITLPQNYRSWLIVFVFEFFLILNEITTTVLLVPPGFETIIVKIYNLLHYGDLSQILFLSLMQIFIVLLGLALFIFIKGIDDRT